jgi:uroporphyrinogen-III synthase
MIVQSMSGTSSSRTLAGRGIVITRPAAQAAALADLVRAHGGQPLVFPVIEILDAADPGRFHAIIDRLEEFDIAIFISPSAVDKAMTLISARGALPPGLRLAAPGPGSARELRRHTGAPVLVPARRYDSEGLLDLPHLQSVAGQRVLILRGTGGRELLGDTLRARGAQVEYAECYRRAKPQADPAPLLTAWARGEIAAVIVTSSEGLRNLCEMVREAGLQHLKATPVFVPHARIAATARELGLKKVVETPSGDEAIVDDLMRYFDA